MAFLDLEGLKQLGRQLNAIFLRKDQLVNNLTATVAGSALDACQGKALKEAVDAKTAKATGQVSLSAAGWSDSGDGYQQDVAYQGMTAEKVVVIAPAPASHMAYGENMVYCAAQAADALTFKAMAVPDTVLSVNVLMLE